MRTVSSSAVYAQLPELERCERLHLGQGDTVVHAPGFEDRTMAISETVTAARGARAVIGHSIPGTVYLTFAARSRRVALRSMT